MEKEIHEINLRLKQLVALKMLENINDGRTMLDDYDEDAPLEDINEWWQKAENATDICQKELREASKELGIKIW